MQFADFERDMRAAGYPTVVERTWNANEVVAAHSHPFEARALIVRGEMWLTVGAKTSHLHAGEYFHLPANQEHAERYGATGATYWVGRR